MIKSITITLRQWTSILNKIKEEYPPSVNLSRSKMKRTIGFTPRFDPSKPSLCYLDFFLEKRKHSF